MFKTFLNFAKQNQPISTTGALWHSLIWLSASFCEVEYKNPHYNEMTKQPLVIYYIPGTADFCCEIGKDLLPYLPDCISAIRIPKYPQRFRGQSIEQFSQHLAHEIEQNGDKDLIICAHSRGGLVAAYFAEYLAKSIGVNVHRIIALGTPFFGSNWAIPFSPVSQSITQMLPGENNQFLKNLREKIYHSDTKYFYIAAKNDALVDLKSASNDSSLVDIYEKHGHLSMLLSRKLKNRMRDDYLHGFELVQCLQKQYPHQTIVEDYHKAVENLLQGFEDTSVGQTVIEQLKADIFEIIYTLNTKYHCKNINDKTKALCGLMNHLEKANSLTSDECIDQCIEEFLNQAYDDKNCNKQILFQHLNYGANLFSSKSTTQDLLESLMNKYQGICFNNNPWVEPERPGLSS